METAMKIVMLYFALIPILIRQAEPSSCKVIRFYGKTNAEIQAFGSPQIHGYDQLAIMWGKAFTIDKAGFLLGWYYHQTKISSLYLDIWKVEPGMFGPPDKFVLVDKTKFITTVPGDNTRYLTAPVKVCTLTVYSRIALSCWC
jgi:hypothetical protein